MFGDRQYYAQLISSVEILPNWNASIDKAVMKLLDQQSLYMGVANDLGIPWYWIGAIHFRECGANIRCQILNGEPYNRKTTIHPAGLGPWKNWPASTKFALERHNLQKVREWSLERMAEEAEKWNGGGYKRRQVNSPYLFSGTNHGVGTGYYTKDGIYDPEAVCQTVGVIPIILQIMEVSEKDGTKSKQIIATQKQSQDDKKNRSKNNGRKA